VNVDRAILGKLRGGSAQGDVFSPWLANVSDAHEVLQAAVPACYASPSSAAVWAVEKAGPV
jgi:hypothetical protein